METTQKKSTKIVGIKNAGLVIICCFIIAVCSVYLSFYFGKSH